MLQRYLNLTAKLTDFHNPHKLLPNVDSQVRSHTRQMSSHYPSGMTLGQQSAGLMVSERLCGIKPNQHWQQQQQQQSVSTAAAQPGSSGMTEGCEGGRSRSYWHCKQVGSGYGRQWQELRKQQLFSDWMYKPEQLEDFILG